MKIEELGNAVRSRYKSLVADELDLPTDYDNAPFEKPTDGTAWSRLNLLEGDTVQVSSGAPGSNRWRTYGQIIVGIFVAPEKGDREARQIADVVRNAFRGISIVGAVFRAMSNHSVGLSEGWWQHNCVISFYSDDLG